MTLSAGDIINFALRLVGVLRAGQTANPETLADGLKALNGMVDLWSTMGLTLTAQTRAVYSTIAAQASYTLGPGGDWNAARPAEITGMAEVVAGTPPTERIIPVLTDEEWREVVAKALTSTVVTAAHPRMNPASIVVDLWPVPSAGGQLVVYSREPLTQFADQSTQYSFNPGYDLALKFNLAEVLWPLFVGPQLKNGGVTLPQIQQQAAGYLRTIKVKNFQPLTMSADPYRSRAEYDIFSDSFVR